MRETTDLISGWRDPGCLEGPGVGFWLVLIEEEESGSEGWFCIVEVAVGGGTCRLEKGKIRRQWRGDECVAFQLPLLLPMLNSNLIKLKQIAATRFDRVTSGLWAPRATTAPCCSLRQHVSCICHPAKSRITQFTDPRYLQTVDTTGQLIFLIHTFRVRLHAIEYLHNMVTEKITLSSATPPSSLTSPS